MSSTLKKIVIPLLPAGILRMLRSKHYLKKFQELSGNEEPEMVIIKDYVSPGDMVLDIGANFGTYTKFLSALVGDKGIVKSFEPIPEVRGYLESNINSSGLDQAQIFPYAISDFEGTSKFNIPKFDHSGSNFYEAHLTEEAEGDIEVEVKRLDDLKFDGDVSFVKCDVEGAELNVLKGAIEFIKKHNPIWMLEMNEGPNSESGKEIVAFLGERGYQLKYLGDGELSNSTSRFQGVNYFFIPNSEA